MINTYIRGIEEVVHILVGLAGQGQHLVRVVHGRLVRHVLVLDDDTWCHVQIGSQTSQLNKVRAKNKSSKAAVVESVTSPSLLSTAYEAKPGMLLSSLIASSTSFPCVV